MNEYAAPATIVVVGAQGFSELSNPDQRTTRTNMYTWLSQGLGGLLEECARADRGESLLMQWRTDRVPMEIAIREVLRLAESPPSFRARIAIHTGPVFFDGEGFVGSDLNLTFALNESELLKNSLAEANGPVALLVSDQAHHAVVRHGVAGADPASFHSSVVALKNAQVNAWLHIPREDALAMRIAERSRHPQEKEQPAQGGVHIKAGRDLTFKNGRIAGRDNR